MTDLPRPRQVTTAGVMGVAGSVLVILSLFDTLGSLRTVQVREQIDEYLASPQGRGLGVTTTWFLEALHVVVLVNGALAATVAVLGVYVFQRHRGARLGFTIAAGLLTLGMWTVAGYVPSVLVGVTLVIAFAASMMWSPPARDWFAGRAPQPAEPRPTRASAPPSSWPPSASPPGHDRAAQAAEHGGAGHGEEPTARPAPASYPFGQARPETSQSTHPTLPAPSGAPAYPPPPAPDRRPVAVTVAAVLTWLCAGAVGFLFSFVVLMLLVAQDTLLEAARQSPGVEELGLTSSDLLASFWVMSAVLLFWCLAAMVLALLAFRRVTWAWWLLVASAGMSALFGFLAFPFGLLVALPAAVSVGLLLNGASRRWYQQRTPPGQGPTSYGGGPALPPTTYPGPPPQQPPHQPKGKPPVW